MISPRSDAAPKRSASAAAGRPRAPAAALPEPMSVLAVRRGIERIAASARLPRRPRELEEARVETVPRHRARVAARLAATDARRLVGIGPAESSLVARRAVADGNGGALDVRRRRGPSRLGRATRAEPEEAREKEQTRGARVLHRPCVEYATDARAWTRTPRRAARQLFPMLEPPKLVRTAPRNRCAAVMLGTVTPPVRMVFSSGVEP